MSNEVKGYLRISNSCCLYCYLTFPVRTTRHRLHTLCKWVCLSSAHAIILRVNASKHTRGPYGLGFHFFPFSTSQRLLQPQSADSQTASPLAIYEMSYCALSHSRESSSFPQVARHSRVVGTSRWKATDAREGPTKYLVLRFLLTESCRILAEALPFGVVQVPKRQSLCCWSAG